jgi:transposase
MSATRNEEYTAEHEALLVVLELGLKEWKLGIGRGFADTPLIRTVPGGNVVALMKEIGRAKQHFGLPPEAQVMSCYEAGRDGFWLHRFLESKGVTNYIVDSASIEVNRRARHTKTDRLDAAKLLKMLIRFCSGEPGVWSVVRVPSVEDEDARCLHRELRTLKKERARCSHRIKGLLFSQGVRINRVGVDFLQCLKGARLWDRSPLREGMRHRVLREYKRMRLIHGQIILLNRQRREAIRSGQCEALEKVRRMRQLRGIGDGSSWLFVMELFAWRQFDNRKQLGAVSGLVPVPYQSGEQDRDLGISKAGNRHVRGIAIEIAWAWLRYQPDSELSRWYLRRFGRGGPRARKIGIVALARKLLIALWRWVEFDLLPEGATLKA